MREAVLLEFVRVCDPSTEEAWCEWVSGELFRHMVALGVTSLTVDRFEDPLGVCFSVTWTFRDMAALHTYLAQHVARVGVSITQQFPAGHIRREGYGGQRVADISTQTIRS